MFTKRENNITSDPLCWIWLDLSWFMRATCSVATLTYLLEEADINDDLRIINKTLAQSKQPASPANPSAGDKNRRGVAKPEPAF